MTSSIHRNLFVTTLIMATCLLSWTADAAVFRIRGNGPPLVYLSIGSRNATIDEVSFNVPLGQLGNGNPVTGTPRIRVILANRATPRFSRTAVLTIDSSIPLTNGSATIPFTTISWRSQNNHIPAGRYDGSSSQVLMSFPNSFMIQDRHTFVYDNTMFLEAGAYTGRVTYTLTMP